MKLSRTLGALAASTAIMALPVQAALDLQVVASLDVASAFGLAFDGTNVWYSTGTNLFGRLDQVNMTLLGSTYAAPGWSEMAWDGTNLAFALSNQLVFRSNVDGSAAGQRTLGRSAGLIDGLDIEDGEVWWSPDVSYVAKLDLATGADKGIVLPSAGGYSGVEKVHVGNESFLIVVNDATSPRSLCRSSLTGTIAAGDCATLPNSRYEGLAFDGRYLYAADYYGGRIDKIDLKVDGGSIFVPGVPEPSTYALMALGLAGVGVASRRRSARV